MRKYAKQTALALAAALTVTSAAPATAAQAASVKNLKKATVTKTITVGVGCKQKIAVNTIPTKTKITYVSKNKKVATVSKNGYVKGKKVGTAVVKVKLTYKKTSVIKKCKVTVKKAVKGISLEKKTISLNVGSTYQIKKTVNPSKALQKVSYTSSKKSVATVNSKGKVTAKKAGTAKITVKALDGSGKKAVLTVKVKDNSITATPTIVPSTEPTVVPTTEPTVVPTTVPATTEPTVVPSTAPTVVPTTGPAVTPSTVPTVAPTTEPSVSPELVTKTITAADITDGKATVSGTYDNVIIDASVGTAEITLDNITIKNALTLKGGADYVVNVKKADIANIDVNEAATVSTQSLKTLAAGKVPTIRIAETTVIKNVKIAANVKIEGSAAGKIASVTITAKATVSIEAPVEKLTVEQAATAAVLSIAAKIAELQIGAPETELNIEGSADVTIVKLADTATGTKLEIAGKVGSVTVDAQQTTIKGTGTVTEIAVNANNAVVQGITSNKIAVATGVTGTTVNNRIVSGGNTTSTTTSSGGSSSGGSYVPSNPATSTPATVPPTETPATKSITKTFASTDTMPNFKVTYADGKVEVYTVSKDEVKAYYNDVNKTTLTYSKTVYNSTNAATQTTETVEAPVTQNGITSATIKIDDFTCVANVNILAKSCEVTVSTTLTNVEELSFIGSFSRAEYYKGITVEGAEANAAALITDNGIYTVKFNDLLNLQTAANNTETSIAYSISTSTDSKNATVTKVSENRAYFNIDGVKFEVYIDGKKVYVTASSDTTYNKFQLGYSVIQ